jgi:uncharacterized membrane protein YidH (DUF202 family)
MEEDMTQPQNFRSPAAVIVLSIVTCGIYMLYWIYRFSVEMQDHLDRHEMSPALELFLCIVCCPYIIYWAYKYGDYIKQAEAKANLPVENDFPIVCLLLAVFGFFIIDMAIMQSKMNAIYQKI